MSVLFWVWEVNFGKLVTTWTNLQVLKLLIETILMNDFNEYNIWARWYLTKLSHSKAFGLLNKTLKNYVDYVQPWQHVHISSLLVQRKIKMNNYGNDEEIKCVAIFFLFFESAMYRIIFLTNIPGTYFDFVSLWNLCF